VQVQATLFPLYDRNPQTFVANPMLATAKDYQKATVTILHSATDSSAIWLPIAP
jgi:predicted acyl esterase